MIYVLVINSMTYTKDAFQCLITYMQISNMYLFRLATITKYALIYTFFANRPIVTFSGFLLPTSVKPKKKLEGQNSNNVSPRFGGEKHQLNHIIYVLTFQRL